MRTHSSAQPFVILGQDAVLVESWPPAPSPRQRSIHLGARLQLVQAVQTIHTIHLQRKRVATLKDRVFLGSKTRNTSSLRRQNYELKQEHQEIRINRALSPADKILLA
jgi:hypothetical protein